MKNKKNSRKNGIRQVEKTLINVGLRIAKRGEGALFVVGEIDYKPLVEQKVPAFDIINNEKLLESLAIIDGAVIIDKRGMMRAYGVMIKSTKTLKGFGTRHSAGVSASLGKKVSLVVLVSEEDKKIRILKNGKMIMQIDALQKDVEKSVSTAVELLESIGAGTLGTIGTTLLIPALGISLLPGIIVFGSAYYLGKLLTRSWK